MLGQFLSYWGVDAAQYQYLLQAALKMDFRSQTAMTGAAELNGTKSALRWTVLLNLLFSLFMSIGCLFGEPQTFFFSVLLLGYAMVMVAMSILIEFGLVVISPDDFLILAHRPVSSRTFFAVKFSNLAFYILIVCLSLSLIPALVGLACPDSHWYFPFAYLLVSVLASLFVAAAVVAFYGLLLRRVNYEKFKDLLVYFQVAFSFIFFFGYQVVPRFAPIIKGASIANLAHGWAAAFPSLWFASLVELALGHVTWEAVGLGTLAVVSLGIILPFLFRSISLDYSDQISRMISAGSKAVDVRPAKRWARVTRWLDRCWLSDLEERAFFHFLLTMLRRNRQLKLQLYPNFGIVVAMLAMAFLQKDQLVDPFVQPNAGLGSLIPAMSFVFGTVGICAQLPFSDEYQGSWIFQVAPLARHENILKAFKKAIVLVLFMPLFLLTAILFSFFWPITHALAQSLYGFSVGLLSLQVCLFTLRHLPFSKKVAKGTQTARLMTFFVIVPLFGLMFALPTLFAAGQGWFLLIVGILLSVSLVLGRLNNHLYGRRSFSEL